MSTVSILGGGVMKRYISLGAGVQSSTEEESVP